MKLLLYTHSFAPSLGGAERYVMLLAEGLAKLPSSDAPGPVAIKVATPAPARDFDDSQLAFEVVRQPGVFALSKLIGEADVVHLSGACLAPLFLAWILRKPIVITHHGYTASCPNGLLFYEPTRSVCPGHFMAGRYRECIKCDRQKEGWFRSLSMLFWTFPRRWLCQTASVNIPVTQHVLGRLGLPRSKVIYLGIPDAAGDPRQNADRRCFAYVGRLVGLKGLPVLVQAARILKEQGYVFRVKFIGDGPERPALESLVRDLGLQEQLAFTGFASGQRFESEMESVSTVIMPSIWEETAGFAAIEQMMRGRLVIASDIGGLGEVVGEAGLKCRTDDAASLADCMKQVLDRPEIVGQLGSIARARAQSLFRQTRMILSHVRVYQELVNSDRTPASQSDPS
jgi:glycosyltransferase involved in cell wall biosynthesis